MTDKPGSYPLVLMRAAFFPENSRTSKPVGKGKSIFSLEGLRLFNDDTHEVTGWLLAKVFGRADGEQQC
jgi:hypothetical protein